MRDWITTWRLGTTLFLIELFELNSSDGRYYSRYVYFKELLPLFANARDKGQQAHAMTMLGAGLGVPISTDDIGLDKARAQTIKALKGVMLVFSYAVRKYSKP
jgi:hypothetical protein